jgi:hypothetical protein
MTPSPSASRQQGTAKKFTVTTSGSPRKRRPKDDDVPQRPPKRPSPQQGQKRDDEKQDNPKRKRQRADQSNQKEPDATSDAMTTDDDALESEISRPRTPSPPTEPPFTLVTPGSSVTFGIEDLSFARKRKLTVYGGKLNSLLELVKMAEEDALASGEAKTSKQWSKVLHNALGFLVCPFFSLCFALFRISDWRLG